MLDRWPRRGTREPHLLIASTIGGGFDLVPVGDSEPMVFDESSRLSKRAEP